MSAVAGDVVFHQLSIILRADDFTRRTSDMSRVLSSTAPSSRPEASKPRGTDAICVIGNFAEAERCCHDRGAFRDL